MSYISPKWFNRSSKRKKRSSFRLSTRRRNREWHLKRRIERCRYEATTFQSQKEILLPCRLTSRQGSRQQRFLSTLKYMNSETCHLFIENAQTSEMNKNNVLTVIITVIGSFYCLISHDLPHLINSTPWRCWRCNCCWKWCFLHGALRLGRGPWKSDFFIFFEPKNALSLRNIIGVDDLWFLIRKMVFAPEKNVGKISPLISVKPENP